MFNGEFLTTSLVLELYRGVADAATWARSLDMLSDSMRGSAIFFGRLAPNGRSDMIGHRIDPDCAELLGGPLANAEANPFVRPMMSKAVGRAYLTPEMCGDAALVRSEVFEAVLRPHGQRHVVGAMLENIGGEARTLAFTRPAGEGDYTEDEARFLDRVLPHLARAAHLRDTFADVQCRSAAAFAALDALPRGIVIISAGLEIIFANQEARRIFTLNDGIRASNAGLTVDDRRAADTLRKAFRAAVGQELLPSAPLPAPVAVPRRSGGLPFVISIVPAPELLANSLSRKKAPVTVTIVDPERDTSPDMALLRQIYRLTPVEVRLAAALCEMDLKHSAARLGISINTAKSHLQAIFQKVGVSRQSALVRLITLHTGT